MICENINQPKRHNCARCKTTRTLASSKNKLEFSWACLECNYLNFENQEKCVKCAANHPDPCNSRSSRRKGDWDCPSCSSVNYSSRTSCYKCGKEKPSLPYKQWLCDKCQTINFAHRLSCVKCKDPREVWKCEACDYVNNTTNIKCGNCQKGTLFLNPKDKPRKKSVSTKVKYAGDWECLQCKRNNFARELKCPKCFELKPI